MSIAALKQHTNKDLGDFRFGSKFPCSIHIQVLEAQNLMSADANGFSDPFPKIGVPSSEEKKLTGPKISKTLDPVFDWQCTLNFKDSTCQDTLKVKLYDYDRGSRNDPLGVVTIPLADLGVIGIISGWFYLRSVKDAKRGQETERSHGRVFIRIIGDKYCKPYEKTNPQWIETRRAQLIQLIRSVETEHSNALYQRISFEYNQQRKENERRSQNALIPEDDIPPPPPPSLLDGLAAYKNIVYAQSDIPLARLPDPALHSSSPCYMIGPLQHATYLPAVPIDYVSTQPLSRLQPLSINTPQDEITQNDINIPLVAYKFTVCCASWNVGNAPPSDPHILKEWLRDDCDIYVIGTQENQYPQRKQFKTHMDDFNSSILSALGHQYVLLQQEDMGQIHIHLIVKRTVKALVDVIRPKKPTEATGFLGVTPNKGGCVVAVNILGTSFCFVSSHLAAHAHKAEKRDEDMRSIVKGLQFLGNLSQTSIINAFHHCFWMGDLNYRLKYAGESQEPDGAKYDEMLDMINHNDFDGLLATDQLLNDTLEKRTAFVGFNDAPISFPPTFKVKKGAFQTYDTLRAPSYTDRVLWRSQSGYEKQVQFVSFSSARSVTSSDHKPVACIFNVFPTFPVPCDSSSIENPRLVLTNLSIIGLQLADGLRNTLSNLNSPVGDLNITSIDPLVEFSSPALSQTFKTTSKKNTLMPAWSRDELPALEFKVCSEGRIWESMTNVIVYSGSLPSRSVLASGVLTFKTEDIIELLHQNSGTTRSPIPPLSPTLPSSPVPNTPSSAQLYRTTTSTNGLLELEVDKIVNLFTSDGRDGGIAKVKGYFQWSRKQRVTEFAPQQLTSIQALKK